MSKVMGIFTPTFHRHAHPLCNNAASKNTGRSAVTQRVSAVAACTSGGARVATARRGRGAPRNSGAQLARRVECVVPTGVAH